MFSNTFIVALYNCSYSFHVLHCIVPSVSVFESLEIG